MCPVKSVSPDWYFFGVMPKCAPTFFDEEKRPGSSRAKRSMKDAIKKIEEAIDALSAKHSEGIDELKRALQKIKEQMDRLE
jgi:hypothetical protein